MVHECVSCFDVRLSFFGGNEAFPIPDECPRRGGSSGSWRECGECYAYRDSVTRPPLTPEMREASRGLWVSIVERVQDRLEHGPDYHDLQQERKAKEAVSRFGDAIDQYPALRKLTESGESNPEGLHKLVSFLDALLDTAPGEPDFSGIDSERVGLELMDGLLQSLQRGHETPDSWLREWKVWYTNRRPFFRLLGYKGEGESKPRGPDVS